MRELLGYGTWKMNLNMMIENKSKDFLLFRDIYDK